MLVEICVDSLASAKAAAKGGANRIELCSALKLGGLTPTIGLLNAIKCSDIFHHLDVYCMIRCRDGDFVYCNDEMETMLSDIRSLKAANADGFVFGALLPDGKLDAQKCRQIIEACSPKPVTLHRAFDHSSHWPTTLDMAVATGFKTILTSGLQATVDEGLECIQQILTYADNRIAIMAGSGITIRSLPRIKEKLPNLDAIHSSASVEKKPKRSVRPAFTMGSAEEFDNQKETSAEIVAQIVAFVGHNDNALVESASLNS